MMADSDAIPQTVHRCANCFINIFDASFHTCPRRHVEKFIQYNIYVKPVFKLFEIEVDGEIFFLSDKMELVVDSKKWLCMPTGGMISIHKNHWISTATYAACSLKTVSVLIAIMSGDNWHLKYRIEASQEHCIRLFKLDTVISTNCFLPEMFRMNTSAVIGIKPKSIESIFRVFANETGIVNCDEFDGCISSLLIGNPSQIQVNRFLCIMQTV